MNRAVFLDRDGTIAKDVHYCRRPEDFILFDGAAKAVNFLNKQGFKVIVITNQSGIARGYFTEETLAKIHQKLQYEIAREGGHIDAIYYCPHHPDDNCECRKPKTSLVLQAARDFDIDLEHSFMVGDLQMDVDLGKSAGCRTILVVNGTPVYKGSAAPDAIVPDLTEMADIIVKWKDGSSDSETCKAI